MAKSSGALPLSFVIMIMSCCEVVASCVPFHCSDGGRRKLVNYVNVADGDVLNKGETRSRVRNMNDAYIMRK
jgi:hypothetical protein